MYEWSQSSHSRQICMKSYIITIVLSSFFTLSSMDLNFDRVVYFIDGFNSTSSSVSSAITWGTMKNECILCRISSRCFYVIVFTTAISNDVMPFGMSSFYKFAFTLTEEIFKTFTHVGLNIEWLTSSLLNKFVFYMYSLVLRLCVFYNTPTCM